MRSNAFAAGLRTAMVTVGLAFPGAALPARAAVPTVAPSDPWHAVNLVEPAALAKTLAGKTPGAKPLVLCVGFPFLYRGGHIPGAVLAGPARNASGLRMLKAEVRNLPHDRPIVIYCGCCPWKDCPNVRPAFRALQELGFKDVRVLLVPHNFHRDWTEKGYPTQKGG